VRSPATTPEAARPLGRNTTEERTVPRNLRNTVANIIVVEIQIAIVIILAGAVKWAINQFRKQ